MTGAIALAAGRFVCVCLAAVAFGAAVTIDIALPGRALPMALVAAAAALATAVVPCSAVQKTFYAQAPSVSAVAAVMTFAAVRGLLPWTLVAPWVVVIAVVAGLLVVARSRAFLAYALAIAALLRSVFFLRVMMSRHLS